MCGVIGRGGGGKGMLLLCDVEESDAPCGLCGRLPGWLPCGLNRWLARGNA